MKYYTRTLFIFGLLAFSGIARADILYPNTHERIMAERNLDSDASIYVEQGYTNITSKATTKNYVTNENGSSSEVDVKSKWTGYGVINGLGIEYFKFLRLGVTHTLLSIKSSTNDFETLGGSQLGASFKLVFTAPIANISGSLGMTQSCLDYRNSTSSATYNGTGNYKSVSIERFLHKNLSVSLESKTSSDILSSSSINPANQSFGDIKSSQKSYDVSLKLWF